MLERDYTTMRDYILCHVGEKKLLEQWRNECNGLLPRNRHKTPRELAHAFKVMKGRGYFDIARQHFPSFYQFNYIQLQPQIEQAAIVQVMG